MMKKPNGHFTRYVLSDGHEIIADTNYRVVAVREQWYSNYASVGRKVFIYGSGVDGTASNPPSVGEYLIAGGSPQRATRSAGTIVSVQKKFEMPSPLVLDGKR